MASQGPNSPGTLADDSSVGTVAWANPSNASSSNNSYATASNGFGSMITTHYLKATNFGFSIGGGDTIDGIVVEIERFGPNTLLDYILDNTVKLVIGGSIVGTNKNSATKWSPTESYFTYGGSSDLWGNSISAGDVNASSFGIVLNVDIYNGTPKFSLAAFVDHIRITVYYTAGGGGGSVSKLALLGVG